MLSHEFWRGGMGALGSNQWIWVPDDTGRGGTSGSAGNPHCTRTAFTRAIVSRLTARGAPRDQGES